MTATVTIELTEAQKHLVEEQMQEAGYTSIETYAKSLLLGQLKQDPLTSMADRIRLQMKSTDDQWLSEEENFRKLFEGEPVQD